ncbi:MAG: hypothetical protein B7Z08_05905 [Sphingomonadales bacterium 32-68-7]|nr:MAG: hypothetical protein B7Z33_11155 [Sphingomonadales bacterium 12-68-11]OYX09276.1 MAG: hypothetical protein B7Z08_05905 [Sphingomonadales bacterium 32-68-7]
MTDFADVACGVIERWAARHHPEASNFRWVAQAPAQDWGYDPPAWTRAISEIQRDFERRIGFAIPLPPAEKRKTADFTLLKTHYLLVRKAETKSGQTVLKALL